MNKPADKSDETKGEREERYLRMDHELVEAARAAVPECGTNNAAPQGSRSPLKADNAVEELGDRHGIRSEDPAGAAPTPRTDAVMKAHPVYAYEYSKEMFDRDVAVCDFARQLERELAGEKSRRESAEKARNDALAAQDALRQTLARSASVSAILPLKATDEMKEAAHRVVSLCGGYRNELLQEMWLAMVTRAPVSTRGEREEGVPEMLVRGARMFVTGDMKLMCAPGESDRECLNRCKAEWLQKADAFLSASGKRS